MKKIKILKILFWIVLASSMLYALVGIPLLLWWYWKITVIVHLLLVIFLLGVFEKNAPKQFFNRFYDDNDKKIDNEAEKVRFAIKQQELDFNCALVVVQSLLEKLGIFMSQTEMMEHIGDEKYGTSHWEVQKILNSIFDRHGKKLRAKILYYTPLAKLHQQVVQGQGAIVLFISKFQQDGFSSQANYPHFALVSHIDENAVVLVVPSSEVAYHGETPEGELTLSIDEFHKRFYADMKYLKDLEYKPTLFNPYTRSLNQCWNLLSRGVMIFAYITKILKPGIAIIIEPVEEK